MAGDSTRHAPAIYLKSTGKRVNNKPATGIHALSTFLYGNSTSNLGCNQLNDNRFLYTPLKQLCYPKKIPCYAGNNGNAATESRIQPSFLHGTGTSQISFYAITVKLVNLAALKLRKLQPTIISHTISAVLRRQN